MQKIKKKPGRQYFNLTNIIIKVFYYSTMKNLYSNDINDDITKRIKFGVGGGETDGAIFIYFILFLEK